MSLLSEATIDTARGDIVDVVGRHVELKGSGSEFEGLCPFHQEKTPSFTVSAEKQFYHCFGCGAHGDAIDFVQKMESVDFLEAVRRISGGHAGESLPKQRQSVKQSKAPAWEPVAPIPADAPAPDFTFRGQQADRTWLYRDGDGERLGYVCRFERPDGGKDVIPLSYCANTASGEMGWRWLSFSKPRPLYGLDRLAQHPKAQVIVVEGEKAADAAQARYEEAGVSRDKLVVISWPGGGKAVKHADWSPLAGRNVGLWPDADQKDYPETHDLAGQRMPFLEQPGTTCMLEIADRIEREVKALKFIMPPENVADGWDLADEPPQGFDLLAHTKASSTSIEAFRAPLEGPGLAPVAKPVPEASEPSAEADGEPEEEAGADEDNGHFSVLGFDRKVIYVYSLKRRQVVETSLSQLTRPAGLIELAPLNWWEGFFAKSNGALDCAAAANWINSVAVRRGIFDPARTRGRGAWRDDQRNVFHHGDCLTVDGDRVELGRIRSSFAYEGAAPIPIKSKEIMTAEEGYSLVQDAGKFRWKHPGSGLLVAGWIFLAPICGALQWRPHIWITGAPGAGKSTFLSRYLTPLVQPRWMLLLQGNSTEAGIRQMLKSDARPVLIDEFESNTKRDRDRIESVLTMIRQASSDNDAIVARGTTHGTAQSFAVRSMFALASVGVSLNRGTDRDRVTVLELQTGDNHQWQELSKRLGEYSLDRGLSERLFARALSMLPLIHESVEIFTRVAGQHFGRQRDGDQFGTLLAGCWCMQNDRVPDESEVEILLNQLDFGEFGAGDAVEEDDSRQALAAVMGSPVRLDSHVTRTVAQLVQTVVEVPDHPLEGDMQRRDAVQALGLVGIRVSENESPRRVQFARGHSGLVRLIETTSFAAGLTDRLARVPGATKSNKKSPPEKTRFAGQALRYVSLPLSECFPE
ncbi:CHC2 zinc finger domain-containing protein [Afifella aestuarii]|uniref:CHC2 zinc finger domain-containing protein n=1 Tax=Afifella aestuarii TaxID=1909496 RepID=UPI000FE37672|nr:CHC2 zinc finger domain-containing protein [Afifella aestuarii]